MEQIVQLRQCEYDKLAQLASLNEVKIEQRAQQIWKDKAVAQIDITVKSPTALREISSLTCYSSVFYKDDRFQIPYELRERLSKIIERNVMRTMKADFGEPAEILNQYSHELSMLRNAKYWMWGIAASGWAAFVAYVCLH